MKSFGDIVYTQVASILTCALTGVLLCLCPSTHASPIPGVGSSQVSQLLKNIVVSELGFRIGSPEQTYWTLKKDPAAPSGNTFLFFPTDSQQKSARFTVSVDKFSSSTAFDAYVKKWIKEYPYFGFEILKTQTMKISEAPCYLVDLVHRKQNKQLRQFVVVKKDFAVVMTCADEPAKFKETALHCADLVKHFQWTK